MFDFWGSITCNCSPGFEGVFGSDLGGVNNPRIFDGI